MARRNRKRARREGVAFPVPFVGIIVLVVSLGLVYVWLDCQCNALGKAIKTLEIEQQDLQKKAGRAQFRWAQLKSPQNLDAVLARYSMEMHVPQWNQVVKLDRPALSDTRLVRSRSHVRAYAGIERDGRDE